MHKLADFEAVAGKAVQDRDYLLGLILACVRDERLFAQAGFDSFASYLNARKQTYGFGVRQAERLIRGHRLLKLLRKHKCKPTSERQVGTFALPLCARQVSLTLTHGMPRVGQRSDLSRCLRCSPDLGQSSCNSSGERLAAARGYRQRGLEAAYSAASCSLVQQLLPLAHSSLFS